MIPHALDIERLANAMAATQGTRLVDLEPEARSILRVYAGAALTRLGVEAKAEGKAHLAAQLQAITASLRAAAVTIEAAGAAEARIAELHRQAGAGEDIAAVLLGMEPPKETPPAKTEGAPEAMEEEAV